MPENVNTSALSLDSSETSKPVDNRPDMVRVDHVSMVFNMASEQLNSLKEYLIKIARRELFFEGFTALDDISFVVKKGDVFGIIGTNGSGKSTMLKIIAGVLEPTKGHCEINGNIAPLIELGAGFDTELSAERISILTVRYSAIQKISSMSTSKKSSLLQKWKSFLTCHLKTIRREWWRALHSPLPP